MDRTYITLNENWKFHYGEVPQAWYKGYDDSAWTSVTLPHDWSVHMPFEQTNSSGTGYLSGGIGWYRVRFSLPEAYKGKRVRVVFDGIYKNSRIWCNSYHIGKRPYGYTQISYDITDFVQFGAIDNEITVRVCHTDLADSRWFTGSGIYRKAYLVVEEQVHAVWNGVAFNVSRADEQSAAVCADAEIVNELDERVIGTLTASLKLCGSDEESVVFARVPAAMEAHEKKTFYLNGMIGKPKLWSCESPSLYELCISFEKEDENVIVLDKERVGIRTFSFDADQGFFLNGKETKFKGVCVHHDGGCLGAAMYREVWLRRLLKLKEGGCNAIRCSHNPHMPELYDLCDELGLLMMDEAFDEWENPKNKWSTGHNVYPPKHEGYAEDFPEWHERDLADMVRRDRNHPSIFLWSIGNEVDYPNDPYSHPILDGAQINQPMFGGYKPDAPDAMRIGVIAKRLAARVRAVDTSRPVTGALAGVVMSNETEYPDAVDVVGYNYTENRYDEDHATYPKRVIYGSENGSGLDAWYAVKNKEFIFGQFIWTGTDYLGESGAWPSRGLYTGLLDFGSFPKPRGHFRASLWSEKPVTYIGTYPIQARFKNSQRTFLSPDAWDIWNYDSGQEIRVVCYTNAPQARLLLNGKVVGDMKPYDEKSGIIYWDIPYQTGELKAEGCDTNGNIVSSYSIQSSGRPYALRVSADRTTLSYDRATVHLIVEIIDENGTIVKLGDNDITCTIEGPAHLLGLEGSDNRDMSDYTDNHHRAFHGRLLTYVQTTGEKGQVRVKFTSPLLQGTEVLLNVE